MHPNPAFRGADAGLNLAFARETGFGTLAVNAEDGPLISHVPFEIDAGGGQALLHLVRSNPILPLLDAPQPAVIAVTGPGGYISPDWYGIDDQVPTWNYVAVHLRGTLARAPDETLRGVLDGLSAERERRLADKRPWTSDKMSPGVMARMMRQVVPVTLAIETVDGTWKLGQNKPDAARHAAADAVEAQGNPALARLMRDPPA